MEKNIYIVLTDTGTFFTKMIRLYTKQPLNHVSIAFDDELSEVYSFGRKRPHNPFIGGFVREELKSSFFQQANCGVYRCKVSQADYEKMMQKIRQIEKNKHNYRYNFIGLFGVMFNREIKRQHAFFCSQFVATILMECESSILECSPYLVQPHHFVESEHLQLVYEGEMSRYPNQNWEIKKFTLA